MSISTWNGGAGDWSSTSDWTPATVPNNSGANTYAVTIGFGGTNAVTLDISPTVDSLTLGAVLRGNHEQRNHYADARAHRDSVFHGRIARARFPFLSEYNLGECFCASDRPWRRAQLLCEQSDDHSHSPECFTNFVDIFDGRAQFYGRAELDGTQSRELGAGSHTVRSADPGSQRTERHRHFEQRRRHHAPRPWSR